MIGTLRVPVATGTRSVLLRQNVGAGSSMDESSEGAAKAGGKGDGPRLHCVTVAKQAPHRKLRRPGEVGIW